jgi:hypothetical protein
MAGPAYYSATMNIAKNEDWVVAFVYGTPAADGSITPIDLSDSLIKLEIRKRESDHEAIVSVSSPANGITITNAAAGAFTVAIARDKLIRLAPGDYVTDMVRETSANYQERLWEGVATVVEGTTR